MIGYEYHYIIRITLIYLIYELKHYIKGRSDIDHTIEQVTSNEL